MEENKTNAAHTETIDNIIAYEGATFNNEETKGATQYSNGKSNKDVAVHESNEFEQSYTCHKHKPI